jgi:hexosaminidase
MLELAQPKRRFVRGATALALLAVLVVPATANAAQPVAAVPLAQVVPAPVSVQQWDSVTFSLTSTSAIYTTLGSKDAHDTGTYLAGLLRGVTGFPLPVVPTLPGLPGLPGLWTHGIVLQLGGADPKTGAQGYELTSTANAVVIKANHADGLFAGVQTLRQLLPAKVEATTVQTGPWTVQGGHILDYPRYAYRGAMLDVARHYFPVSTVERYIDDIARYKIDYLHLHLTDDQGWRIAVDSWPNLTTVGSATGEGGVGGGFYTKADYQAIVAYAQQRHITVIPEIEGPAHSQAALASYPELNCDGQAPDVYTGIGSGDKSELCVGKDVTYKFLDQVIGEIAAMTPGPYISIGADETQDVTPQDFATYIAKVVPIVAKYGKKIFGWQEALNAAKPAGTTAEYWIDGVNNDQVIAGAQQGAKIVMSPSTHAYLDMKYTPDAPPPPAGNSWAGYVEAKDSYDWLPDQVLPGVPASSIVGVEASLWGDTVFRIAHIEELAFPRLPAIAEIGWSPAATHDWTSFSTRLAAQGPRWKLDGIPYYASPQVPWPPNS